MQALLGRPLRRLAGTLADLRLRVREALAGELGRAVGEAVREAVAAAVRGGPAGERPDYGPTRTAPDHWAGEADPWGDRPGRRDDGYGPDPEPDEFEPAPAPPAGPALVYRPPAGPAAVSAGLAAGEWWLRRRGSVPGAVGVGVLVALAVLAGGPLARAGAAAAATAADLLAAADALGAGAARPAPV